MFTTRYNVYFNGQESMLEGQNLIAETHKENYEQLLPVFLENNKNARLASEEAMDRAISKAVKAIELHSITAKPRRRKRGRESEKYREFRRKKEYNNMVDECYLLLGKAQFYKQQYFSTERTFKYILREYKDHPVHYEAAIWYARNLAEQNKFFRALRTVEDAMKEPEFPEHLVNFARATKADMFIRREKYPEAIEELTLLTENTRKPEGQSRYYYLLAQLYALQGDKSRAQSVYQDLIDTRPDYVIAFHAKINKALLYGGFGNEFDDRVIKELNALLRDGRNTEYFDQVYYALAQVESRNGNDEKAEEYYWQSTEVSVSNDDQKARSFLKLGDYYFEKKADYTQALNCYSNASELITEDYAGYDEITGRLASLSSLMGNLEEVRAQDSLRNIAQMPELERDQFIQNLMLVDFQNLQEKSKQKGRKQKNNRLEQSIADASRPLGDWYFYNPVVVERGRAEFSKRWGKIQLTDDWRRGQKNVNTLDVEEPKAWVKKGDEEEEPKERTFSDYLKGLPLTDAQQKASEQKAIEALYNAGVIYEDELENYPKAREAFADVIERKGLPEKIDLNANYHLYILNNLLEDRAEAEAYKNSIIQKYPESNIAKVLQDPTYYAKIEEMERKANQLYEEAYDAYDSYEFSRLRTITEEGVAQYSQTSLQGQFLFMRAVAIGYTADTTSFREALNDVMTAFPNEEIRNATQGMLAQLDNGIAPSRDVARTKELEQNRNWKFGEVEKEIETAVNEQVEIVEKKEVPENYRPADEEPHFFILILPKDLNIETIRDRLQQASQSFSNKNLRVSRRGFNASTDMLVVRTLEGKEEALHYFASVVIQGQTLLQDLNSVDYRNFIISESNFEKLIKDRQVEEYLGFYLQHYFGEGAGVPDEPEEEKKVPEEEEESQEEQPGSIEEVQESIDIPASEKILLPNVSFNPNLEEAHSFALIVSSKDADINYLWTALYRYDESYRVSKKNFAGKRILIVKGLENKERAYEYLFEITKQEHIYDRLKEADYRNFIITDSNLDILMQTEAVDNYIQFFKENYLTKK